MQGFIYHRPFYWQLPRSHDWCHPHELCHPFRLIILCCLPVTGHVEQFLRLSNASTTRPLCFPSRSQYCGIEQISEVKKLFYLPPVSRVEKSVGPHGGGTDEWVTLQRMRVCPPINRRSSHIPGLGASLSPWFVSAWKKTVIKANTSLVPTR